MRVPDRYRAGISRYTPADADDLRAFQLRTFESGSREVDAARTAWLFDRNPCRTADGTRDIYVCRRDGEIVGQQAEIPFDLRVGGRDRRAAWTVDLMVDDEWRLRGVGPGLMATQLDARPLSFGLNLSEKGYATYTRSGWTDLGVVPVYLRPLDLAAAARGGLLPGRAGRVAPVAGPVLRFADVAAVGALRAAGARLVDVERLDARSDDVWAAASGHYPVLARRDLAALAWRIDDRPDAALLHRHYLVVRGPPGRVHGGPGRGTPATPTAVVVDYLAPPRWVAPLLVATGRAARGRGAVAMSVKTRNGPADRALRLAGFVRRERGADEPIRFMAHAEDDDGAWRPRVRARRLVRHVRRQRPRVRHDARHRSRPAVRAAPVVARDGDPHSVTDLALDVVTDDAGLAELRGVWADLSAADPDPNVFLTWAWASTWWQHFGAGRDDRELHVVVVRDGATVVGLAPLYRARSGAGPLRTSVLQRLNPDAGDYGGMLLGRRAGEAVALLVDHLGAQLQRDVDVVVLTRLASDARFTGLLGDELVRHAATIETVVDQLGDACLFTDVRGDFDLRKQAKKHKIGQRTRRLGDQHGGVVFRSTPATRSRRASTGWSRCTTCGGRSSTSPCRG